MIFNNSYQGLQYCFDQVNMILKSFNPPEVKKDQLHDLLDIAEDNDLKLAVKKINSEINNLNC